MRILITGASGSGTTTLGCAVAGAIDAAFLDADDLYWLPTDPPFKEKRAPTERRTLLRERLAAADRIVVAGSIMGWDGDVEDSFSVIVFIYAPAEIRVPRLRARELERLGRIDEDFLVWAAQYDTGLMQGRSLARQLAWLDQRHCPILRLSGSDPVDTLLASVRAVL